MKHMTYVGSCIGDTVKWADGYTPRLHDALMARRDGTVMTVVGRLVPNRLSPGLRVEWYVPALAREESLYAMLESFPVQYEYAGWWCSTASEEVAKWDGEYGTPAPGTVIFDASHQPVGYSVDFGQKIIWYHAPPASLSFLYIRLYADKAETADTVPEAVPGTENRTYAPHVLDVLNELHRAELKFPEWTTDPLHALAVLGEEFGELTHAMLELKNEPEKPRATIEHVRTEAIQTAAMALRLLKNIDKYDFTKK